MTRSTVIEIPPPLQKQLSLIEEEPKETDFIDVDENDSSMTAGMQDKRKYSLQQPKRKTSRGGLKERFSLPNIIYRKASTDSTVSTESLKFHLLDKEWRSIFDKLDSRDGKKDNKIQRKAFLKWVSTLSFQNALSLETKQGVSREKLKRIISHADEDKDGYIDRDEFYDLIMEQNLQATKVEQSRLRKYIRIAAYAEEYRWWPPPIFTILITLVQVGYYVYHAVHLKQEHNLEVTWDGPAPYCSTLIYNPQRRWQPWRYFTYCLVHAGIAHILFNVLMQLFVGLPLEMSHNSLRVGFVYVTGVLAGSLGTSCFDPRMYLAGASGGVYALIASHLSTLILNWKEDTLILRQRVREGRATNATHGRLIRCLRLTAVLVFALMDTSMAVYSRYWQEENNTGYTAHLAGAAAGLAVGIVVLKNRRVEYWEVWLRVACILCFVSVSLAAVLWNVYGDVIYQSLYNFTYFPEPNYETLDGHSGNCIFYNTTLTLQDA